jgi:hypothetical protein
MKNLNTLPYKFDPETGKVTVRGTDHFPREIFDIGDRVEIIDMSTVNTATLPADLGRLTNLRVIFLSYNNALEVVPEVLGTCGKLNTIGMRACKIREIPEHSLPPSLRALILTDNQITKLPESIGKCTELKKIAMAGNQLRTLPPGLLNCQDLEFVRFSVNNLSSPPGWLLELPNLAWYADSSNPYSTIADQPQTARIEWGDISLGEVLGRSNNNIVRHGRLKDGSEVAVKIYGHGLVTDGLPEDDMNACLRIGNHPNVIGGIGKSIDTSNGQQVLVMPLIPSGFENLGKPPSLSTICRDTYDEGRRFTVSYTHKVLKDVAMGMQHIHSKGVMHGDLYAHNIMTDKNGRSYVGDFGAASPYRGDSKTDSLREHVDVRAFGVLINELTSRCTPSIQEETNIAKIQQLATDCLNKNTSQRPSFAEITEMLTALGG